MTPREAERRLSVLEGTVLARYPDPDPPATELERWAATLSDDVLMRIERLFRAMADDPERADRPITHFEHALIDVTTLDADYGDADSVRRSYLASQPHDPIDPARAELREWIERWISGPEREFMRGADVRGWLAWHGVVVDQLGAGELTRLAALLRVLEDHPIEGAAVSTDVIWCVVGEHGQRKRQGLV